MVASYVAAALEADMSWQRIERFFISSIEGDSLVKVREGEERTDVVSGLGPGQAGRRQG